MEEIGADVSLGLFRKYGIVPTWADVMLGLKLGLVTEKEVSDEAVRALGGGGKQGGTTRRLCWSSAGPILAAMKF